MSAAAAAHVAAISERRDTTSEADVLAALVEWDAPLPDGVLPVLQWGWTLSKEES